MRLPQRDTILFRARRAICQRGQRAQVGLLIQLGDSFRPVRALEAIEAAPDRDTPANQRNQRRQRSKLGCAILKNADKYLVQLYAEKRD